MKPPPPRSSPGLASQQNQVAVGPGPHDTGQRLQDRESGSNRAVEALLGLLRISTQMLDGPEQRAARDRRHRGVQRGKVPERPRDRCVLRVTQGGQLLDHSGAATGAAPQGLEHWDEVEREAGPILPGMSEGAHRGNLPIDHGRWASAPAIQPSSITDERWPKSCLASPSMAVAVAS